MFTEEQRQLLLRTARESIARHLGAAGTDAVPEAPLLDASGVFVTIKSRGVLRGCLGVLDLRAPLIEEVARCARDSATEDPRFPPMALSDLADVSLEISVLGPIELIDPLEEGVVIVGRHGLVVEQGRRRGLLLPQVAVEWGWTAEQFLRQTCHKAGLPLDAWQNGALVFRFEAEVFGE